MQEFIEIIRQKAKEQHKTLKSVGEYAGMKSTYINKFLAGGCVPSTKKLLKIAEYLHIDNKVTLSAIGDTIALQEEVKRLEEENRNLKATIKRYEQLDYIYNNYDKLEKLYAFLTSNTEVSEAVRNFAK